MDERAAKAIDYIEEHLDEEIDYTGDCQAGIFNFHFQRVFLYYLRIFRRGIYPQPEAV